MNTFICYPKCSTCKKAEKYLKNNCFGVLNISVAKYNVNIIAIKATTITAATIIVIFFFDNFIFFPPFYISYNTITVFIWQAFNLKY